jgi:HlyD family secretion protein
MSALVRSLFCFAIAALAACSNDGGPAVQGYVEGTYVYVSAESGGRLVSRPATAGARVAEGDLLFAVDDADQTAAVAGAEARLAQAQAQLANLKTGERPEEVSVLAATLSSARATAQNAEDDYRRKLQLKQNEAVAQSVVDAAKTASDTAEAQVNVAQRQLEVARLPARPEEIDAAARNVTALQSDLTQARTALDRRTIRSPAAGLVEETYYEPGEMVTAGQPVVSLLPTPIARSVSSFRSGSWRKSCSATRWA